MSARAKASASILRIVISVLLTAVNSSRAEATADLCDWIGSALAVFRG
jgi:hypothetical protein